jgi:stress-induced morphogen
MLATSILEKCKKAFNPILCELVDESWKHAGHLEMLKAAPLKSQETHFALKIVSEAFRGVPLVKRHQMVYGILQEEFSQRGLHALSLDLKANESE